MAVRVNGHHYGRRANGVLVVFPDKGFEGGGATNGETGGTAILDDEDRLYAGRVEDCRVAQLVFLNNVLNLQEAIKGIFEGGELNVRVHLPQEIIRRNFGSWI